MSVTDIVQGGVVVCLQQLVVEQLPVEEVPGAAHVPGNGGATGVVGEHGCLDTPHKQCSKLAAAICDHRQLKNAI